MRLIAEKYGVPFNTLKDRASRGHWGQKRREAHDKAVEKAQRKTAEAFADNATLLEQIKTTLLRKLAKMAEAYPENGAGDMRKKEADGTELIDRMRDIAAVYESLSEKTIRASIDMEDLSPLAELLRDE